MAYGKNCHFLSFLKFSAANLKVGEKVTIVSRKTHTTRREILGVSTRGDTQLVSFLAYYLLV